MQYQMLVKAKETDEWKIRETEEMRRAENSR